MRVVILRLIDLFYPPFRKIMPLQTFRYAACGGSNAIFSNIIFLLSHKYIFKEAQFDIGFYALKSYSAALFLSFCASFTLGFILNKYIVFTTSNLRGHIQLFRYFLSLLVNLVTNYFLLKIFVEYFKTDAVLAQAIATILVIGISYLTQNYFTFKVKKSPDAHVL